ncbi:MAG: NusA-like transcription termination signal-binding factor [Candidatus Woesearchaeota archaeon]
MRRKIDNELLNSINVFLNVSNAKLKDCFNYEGVIYFIVDEGELGKAVGLKGVFAKTIRERLKKNIKIVEFSKDPVKFIKNFLLPIQVDDIFIQDNVIYVVQLDKFQKAKIIGKQKKNLNLMNELVKQYYGPNLSVYVK